MLTARKIIDLLEIVNIAENDGDRLFLLDTVIQAVLKIFAVIQLG